MQGLMPGLMIEILGVTALVVAPAAVCWHWGYRRGSGGSSRRAGKKASGKFGPEISGDLFYAIGRDITAAKLAEAKLRENESLFRQLADSMPQIVWITDGSGRINYFNERWYERVGLNKDRREETEPNQNWRVMVHPDDVEKVATAWAMSVSESVAFSCEYRLWDVQAQDFLWYSGQSRPIPDGCGKIRNWFGTATLIEDHRRAVQNLKNSEDRLASIIDQSPIPTQFFARDGAVTKVNRAWQDFWGMSDEVVADSILSNYNVFTDPVLIALGISEDAENAIAGNSMAMPSVYYNPGAFGRSGAPRWMDVHLSPIRSAGGQIHEISLVLSDVTAQVEAREMIRGKQEEMEAILENSPAAIFMKDLNGRLVMINRQFERVFVQSRLELEDLDERRVWRENQREQIEAHDRRVLQSRGPIQEEMILPNDQGGQSFLFAKFPVFDRRGEIRAISGILTEVTEQKRIEAAKSELEVREKTALQTSRLKSEFLANMSHEIRTPINGVIGMTGLLMDTPLTEEQRDFADAIRGSGETLLTVINDILDFSKIEAGKLEFECLDFALSEVIEDARKTLAYAAHKKGLNLLIDLPDDLRQTLRGDPGRLRQIFLNLLSNAIKFTAKGDVKLRGRLGWRNSTEARLRFEVDDTGIGMSADEIGRIFTPFTQVDSSMQRRFGGTGLGLSICKRLVEQMNGDVGVHSAEGKGSCFWFEVTLPYGVTEVASPQDALNSLPSRFASGIAERRKLRILVAEDNPVNQVIALKMLEKMGLYADAVGNGHEALAALQSAPYDLILMDCQMPEMDGYETTRQIRNGGALWNAQIPILALTANAMAGDSEKCLEAGMDGYISKPISRIKLESTVTHWADRILGISGDAPRVKVARQILPGAILEETVTW